MSAIPGADFGARLARLRTVMAAQGAAGFICDHGEMLAWLTGYSVSETRYRACVVPLSGEPVWVLRNIDEAPCRQATWVARLQLVADHEDPFGAVADVIAELGLSERTLAADYTSYGFTAHVQATLAQRLPNARWINLAGVSDTLRSIKDASEIARLQRAATIADGAMHCLMRALQPGMRPRDAAAIAASYYLQNGADDWWVGPISVSRRAAVGAADIDFLHRALIDQRLEPGDVLHVELVPRVEGYSARMMRSISVGEPAPALLALMDQLVALQDRQLTLLRAGAASAAVDAALRRPVLQAKLRRRFDNATGYQIGLYTKTPRSSDFSRYFHPAADWVVEAGMTFHMYLSAQGLAISDSFVVTDAQPRRLTAMPRRLLVSGAA